MNFDCLRFTNGNWYVPGNWREVRMQSPLLDDRNMSMTMINGHTEDSGRLVIGNTDDNLYLQCGDSLFNISNLVSEQSLKRSRSAKAYVAPVSARKQREGRIYPSRHQVESMGDIDIGMVFAKARPVRSVESMVGYDGGRGPGAYEIRYSTSGYCDNSERNMYRNSNGIVGSRSELVANKNDTYSDTYSEYSYHRRRRAEVTPSSTIYGGSDHYQLYRNPASSPNRNLNPQSSGRPIELEISPGVFAPLRGSEETWRAIQAGNVETVVCVCCCNRIQCIADAEYVICPECRVVSPVGDPYRERPASGLHIRGVGLGLLIGA
jgi:hypothetical protein